ncbi:hypothetical protein [Brevibacillus antibioticus]|uniref:hypothetical protein n=1 Tax=Brevibacillus antibioticus TaxID=2570228 RepID=UPI001FCB8E0B|nr:hypothetical protein [Brevibacillus antibioticus]
MKRITGITIAVVAGLLVGGCSSSSSAASELTQPLAVEQKQAEAEPKVVLDENFLKSLEKNEINGFPIAIGMKKEEVISRYGKVTKEDFWNGGIYHSFEKLEGGAVLFDGKDRVYGIELEAQRLSETNLEAIIKKVGKPSEQGMSDLSEQYVIYYEAADNLVRIYAADEKLPAGKVRNADRMIIFNKKLYDEAPR